MDVVVPLVGEAVAEVTLVRWLKTPGDRVAAGEGLFEVDTDKAVVTIDAFTSGVLTEVLAPAGSAVMPQQAVGRLEPADPRTTVPVAPPATHAPAGGRRPPVAEPAAAVARPPAHTPSQRRRARLAAREIATGTGRVDHAGGRARVLATPKAKRLARERGLDLRAVGARGSGPGGLLTATDLPVGPGTDGPSTTASLALEAPSRARRVTAERLTRSVRDVPQFVVHMAVDMSGAVALRRRCVDEIGWQRPPTYGDLLVRAAAAALQAAPELNRQWRAEGILQLDTVTVGLVVATDRGIVVPVIPEQDLETLRDVAAATRVAAARAQSGALGQADLAPRSVTISNLGPWAVDSFTAILDPPDAFVLAAGRVADTVVAVCGAAEVRPMLNLTLTVDHRIFDGVAAAGLLGGIREALQNTSALLGSAP